jgi:hypothetical protein
LSGGLDVPFVGVADYGTFLSGITVEMGVSTRAQKTRKALWGKALQTLLLLQHDRANSKGDSAKLKVIALPPAA